MDIDTDKIDEAVLALLHLTLHDGNRVWKRVGLLLDVLGRMEVWLAHHGRTGLTREIARS